MLASLLIDILEKELAVEAERQRAERAKSTSLRDPLTDLYNLRGWEELARQEMRRCQRYGNSAVIFSVDLDNLKLVNDRDGHPAGDALLKQAAATFRSIARESDIIARVGGDEFWMLAVECARSFPSNLRDRPRESRDAANVSVSIGMACLRDYPSLTAAMQAANQEMYAEKRQR